MTTARHDDDIPGGEVVQLRKTDLVPVETAEPDRAPGALRQGLARVTDRPFPTRHTVKVEAWWWAGRLSRLIPWLPWLALLELRPISRGIGRAVGAWARWASAERLHSYARLAEGTTGAKLGVGAEHATRARQVGSLTVAAAVVAGMWWLWAARTPAGVAVTLLALAVLDLAGRRGAAAAPAADPVALPSVLGASVPLRQITAGILAAFEREGFEEGSVRVAVPLGWAPARSEYRISLAVQDAIRPEHLRAVERAIGARDYAIRSLATETSTVRQLVIRVGDPLAAVGPPPYIPTGSTSVTEALDLGESAGDLPFEVRFGGAHTAIVGKTGSGKSKGMLWTVIDRLSACRDVVLWGIDLQAGPALPMWRGVIQRAAYNEDDAERLLTEALAEIDRRMKILQILAESDDEDDDADEWHPGLGPALFIPIDEFAVLSDYDGKKKSPDLMGPVERIVRTGRKVWVHLILATQKTGNSDFGSTVISSQVAVKILMACEETDTVRLLSTAKRDAGWAPHHLQPAVEGDPRDAGKAYLSSPAHDLPDEYRCYLAMTTAEVKRRARQRMDDGLPTLDGRRRSDVVDVVEVPAMLAAVEAAFRAAGDPDRMATADLLGWLADGGCDVDAAELAEQLRPCELRPQARWRPAPGANSIRGYFLADVRDAIRRVS